MSGKLENLRQLLLEGYTPRDLVIQGYPKSSVYKAADQVRRGDSSRVSPIGAQVDGLPFGQKPYILQFEPGEAQTTTELEAKLDESTSWTSQIKEEYERARIEREESHKAAIAEEQARREQERISRARRLVNDAHEAYRVGKISKYQLTVLTSSRKTMDDIESGKNTLRGLVADASIRLQREALQAAAAEEQAKAEQARREQAKAEQARREQAQKVENARARLFRNAIAAHKAGKIDSQQLLVLTRGRHTLEAIEGGEKLLKVSSGNTSTH
jgi:hypothetical protein